MQYKQISKKKYLCTFCKTEVFKETNHYNEIYSECKKCKNDILICIEDIALNKRQDLEEANDIAFKRIVFYEYDISLDKDYNEYQKLVTQLSNKNYNCFNVFDMKILRWDYFKQLDNKSLMIYKPNTFKNQYIGLGIRLHNWYERITFNSKLKIGYYLEDE